MLIRLPLDIVLWLLFFAGLAILWILGFPICYFLARAGGYEAVDSPYFKLDGDPTKPRRVLAWKPRWVNVLYGNWEDGVGGPQWWDDRVKGTFSWKEVFLWSAWRNPVNNLRFVPVIHPVPDPVSIRYVGNSLDPSADLSARRYEASDRRTPFWCYATQGVFAGFWIIWPWGRGQRLDWFNRLQVALTQSRLKPVRLLGWIFGLPTARHFRLRIGWKILPRDAVRGVVDDYRQHFYPFGFQFTPWRKG